MRTNHPTRPAPLHHPFTKRPSVSILTLAAALIAWGVLRSQAAPHTASKPVVDSRMTLAQALKGAHAPERVRRNLTIVSVRYQGFDGRTHQGQIVVRRDIARQVAAIFNDLHRMRFPIKKAVPVVRYRWSDAASMADNNSSGFNYRGKPGESGLSRHAFGAAIDINPCQNPYELGKRRLPPGAAHRPGVRGTITDGPVVRAFTRRGWRWGGHFRHNKDWQHFDKPPGSDPPRRSR
jgi:hypothetical protein